MQLNKLSLYASIFLVSSCAMAEDYVNVQILHYSENDSRVTVLAPSVEVNKEFGTDYTLNASVVTDSVSGASPTYYDAASGASAYSRGTQNDPTKIKKENITFEEQRTAGTLNLITRLANRDEIQTGLNLSREHDFYSNEISGSYLHYLDNSKNRSVSIGGSYQSNEILVYQDASSGASQKMTNNVSNLQLGFSQVIDSLSVVNGGLFYGSESGYLSSPYHNIVRNTNTIEAEKKPESKISYGIKLGYIKSFSNLISSQINYKYYSDDWGIDSHTLDALLYYEMNDKTTIGGGLRYYTQTQADFYGESFTTEKYASSDERFDSFHALTYKADINHKIDEKTSYNFGVNLYNQSTGLEALYFTTGIKYKF